MFFRKSGSQVTRSTGLMALLNPSLISLNAVAARYWWSQQKSTNNNRSMIQNFPLNPGCSIYLFWSFLTSCFLSEVSTFPLPLSHSITTGHCLAVDMLIRKFDSGPTQVCLFIKYHHPSTQSMSKTIIGWSVLPLPLPGAMHTKFLYSSEDANIETIV